MLYPNESNPWMLLSSRAKGDPVGFAECLQRDSFDSYKEGRLLLRLQKFQFNTTAEHEEMIEKIKKEKAESELSKDCYRIRFFIPHFFLLQ